MEYKFVPYERRVNYYETDKMGIVHHSNYIRWFEEARIDFMDKMGADYKTLEDSGIIIPVMSVNCDYKLMVRFGDTVVIKTAITVYTGTRMTVAYEVFDKATGELCTTGETTHCFLGANGRPVSLKRANPHYHERFGSSSEGAGVSRGRAYV